MFAPNAIHDLTILYSMLVFCDNYGFGTHLTNPACAKLASEIITIRTCVKSFNLFCGTAPFSPTTLFTPHRLHILAACLLPCCSILVCFGIPFWLISDPIRVDFVSWVGGTPEVIMLFSVWSYRKASSNSWADPKVNRVVLQLWRLGVELSPDARNTNGL